MSFENKRGKFLVEKNIKIYTLKNEDQSSRRPELYLPLLREVHSTCVTFTEKLLEKDAPLVTAVKTTGELEERPMSTYTAREIIFSSIFKNKH